MIKRVWLFLGGEFYPPSLKPEQGDIFIAVDSGIKHCVTMNINPHIHIGDFDSSGTWVQKFPNCQKIKFPQDKDQTDFELALNLAVQKYPQAELHIIGSSGGEEDHAFGNLLTLKKFSATVYLWQQNSLVLSAKAPYQLTIRANKGAKVSVFALENIEGLTYSGLRWSLNNANLNALDTYCSRNELSENQAQISWKKGQALIFLPKNYK